MANKSIKIIILLLLLLIVILIINHYFIPHKPNVVVIVIDALRPDRLPFYGYKKATAPFMSRLASKGVVFQNAYSVTSWTAPSVASIFTSLYPFQHGVTMGLLAQRKQYIIDPTIHPNRIPESITTLAEFMKEQGYQTYGVADNDNISDIQGFHQGFDQFINHSRKTAKKVNEECRHLLSKTQSNKPYFLYIHYNDTHVPYDIPLPDITTDANKFANMKAVYDKEISLVDEHIKALYDSLGWNKNTMIIITADHGEEFKEHGFFGHGGSLNHEVLKVPLLFYFPTAFAHNRKIYDNVMNIDIYPTISDFIRREQPKDLSGISLLPFVQRKISVLNNRYLYAQLHKKRYQEDDLLIKSVLYMNYHYIWQYPDDNKLFDKNKDPKEKINLYTTEKYIAHQLAANLVNFEKTCKKYYKEAVTIQLDQKKIEELKSLGYVQ